MLKNFTGPDGEAGFIRCALYSCDKDQEELIWNDPDEVIEAELMECCGFVPRSNVLAVLKDKRGETVTVYGYTRRTLSPNDPDPDMILEDVLEWLDEEYGNPDEAAEVTPEMRAAAEAFVAAIRAHYKVWQCEQTHSAEVNVEEWVREHCPDWLENA